MHIGAPREMQSQFCFAHEMCCSGTSPWSHHSCFHQHISAWLHSEKQSKPENISSAPLKSSTGVQNTAQQEHSRAKRIGERLQAWWMFWSSFYLRKDWVSSSPQLGNQACWREQQSGELLAKGCYTCKNLTWIQEQIEQVFARQILWRFTHWKITTSSENRLSWK